jgi:hypothetical protein
VADPEVTFGLLEQNAADTRRRVDGARVRHDDEGAEALVLNEVQPTRKSVDP